MSGHNYRSLFSQEGLETNSGYPLYDNHNLERSHNLFKNSKEKRDPTIIIDTKPILNKKSENSDTKPKNIDYFPESCSQPFPKIEKIKNKKDIKKNCKKKSTTIMKKTTGSIFSLNTSKPSLQKDKKKDSGKEATKKKATIDLEISSNSSKDYDTSEEEEYNKIKSMHKEDNDNIDYDSDIDKKKTEVELIQKKMKHEENLGDKHKRVARPKNLEDSNSQSSSQSEYDNTIIQKLSKKNEPESQFSFIKDDNEDEDDDDDDDEEDIAKFEAVILNDNNNNNIIPTITQEFNKTVNEFKKLFNDNNYINYIELFIAPKDDFLTEEAKDILTKDLINSISHEFAILVKSIGKNDYSKIYNSFHNIIETAPEIKYQISRNSDGTMIKTKNLTSVSERNSFISQGIKTLEKNYLDKRNNTQNKSKKSQHEIFNIVKSVYELTTNNKAYDYFLKKLYTKAEQNVDPNQFFLAMFTLHSSNKLFFAPYILDDLKFTEEDLKNFGSQEPLCCSTGKKIKLNDEIVLFRLELQDNERSKKYPNDKLLDRSFDLSEFKESCLSYYFLKNTTLNKNEILNIFNMSKIYNNNNNKQKPQSVEMIKSNEKDDADDDSTKIDMNKPTRLKSQELPSNEPKKETKSTKTTNKKQTKTTPKKTTTTKKSIPKNEPVKKKTTPPKKTTKDEPPKKNNKRKRDESDESEEKPKKKSKNEVSESKKKSKNEEKKEDDDDMVSLSDLLISNDNNNNMEIDKSDGYFGNLIFPIINKSFILKYSDKYYVHISPLWNELYILTKLYNRSNMNDLNNNVNIDFNTMNNINQCAKQFIPYNDNKSIIKSDAPIVGIFEILNLLFIDNKKIEEFDQLPEDSIINFKNKFNIDFNKSPIVIDFFMEALYIKLKNSTESYFSKHIDNNHQFKVKFNTLPFVSMHGKLLTILFEYLFPNCVKK